FSRDAGFAQRQHAKRRVSVADLAIEGNGRGNAHCEKGAVEVGGGGGGVDRGDARAAVRAGDFVQGPAFAKAGGNRSATWAADNDCSVPGFPPLRETDPTALPGCAVHPVKSRATGYEV